MSKEGSENFSLLSRVFEGGVIGGKGYNYQDAFIVSRIPDWLADRSFAMLMKEGIEDVDVKFRKGKCTKYYSYQVKDHIVRSPELKAIIHKFYDKNRGAQNIKKFILACRGLDNRGRSFRRAIESLREIRRIYEAENNVLKDSVKDVETNAKKIGLELPLDFLMEKVFFDTDLGDMRSDKRLSDQFVGGIQRIPEFTNVRGLSLSAAYRDLARLVNVSIRKPIKRSNIFDLLQESLELSSIRFEKEGIKVRLYHWEDPSFDLSQPWDLLLDWSKHFDRITRKVPPTSVWRDALIPELREAEKNIRSSTNSRRIIFYLSACLSAGLALGWAFSEVRGYSFVIHQGSDIWHSSTRPSKNKLNIKDESLDKTSKDLCVEFSVAANVRKKVDEFIDETGKTFRARMSLQPDLGVGSFIDDSTTLAYSYDARYQIREKVDYYDCDLIHLFYAGPLGLAILFGRLLNAMHANIQCYEEQQKGYAAACFLPIT